MTRFTPLVLCVALIGAAACSGRSGPQFDRSDVENITKLIEQLRIAFNAKDSSKAAALYSSTGVVMPPNRALMPGRQFVQQSTTIGSLRAPQIWKSRRQIFRVRATWPTPAATTG